MKEKDNKFYGIRKIDSQEVFGDLLIDVHNEYFIREEGSCVWHNVNKETVSSKPFHSLEKLGYEAVKTNFNGVCKMFTHPCGDTITISAFLSEKGNKRTNVTKTNTHISLIPLPLTFEETLSCANIINDGEWEV